MVEQQKKIINSMVKRWISRRGNGILYGSNMSGEMHMQKRNEVFGCIPHGRGAYKDLEYSMRLLLFISAFFFLWCSMLCQQSRSSRRRIHLYRS